MMKFIFKNLLNKSFRKLPNFIICLDMFSSVFYTKIRHSSVKFSNHVNFSTTTHFMLSEKVVSYSNQLDFAFQMGK